MNILISLLLMPQNKNLLLDFVKIDVVLHMLSQFKFQNFIKNIIFFSK